MRRVRRMSCAEHGQVRCHRFDVRGMTVKEWIGAPAGDGVLQVVISAIDERLERIVLVWRACGWCDQQIVATLVADATDQDRWRTFSGKTEWPFKFVIVRNEDGCI